MEWVKENRHLVEAFAWVLLTVPTLVWLKESVLWVALMSLYANYKTAISAHEARKAQKAIESNGN